MKKNIKYCSKCSFDENVEGISFDENGVCFYCDRIESLIEEYGTGKKEGIDKFNKILDEIKQAGKGKKYDCVIGVSGGTDSSYLMIKAKEWGLKPLAVHYDNTWNSAIATQNIRKVTEKLDIDLYTHVVNNEEVDDVKRSQLLAGIPGFDMDTDLGLVQVMRSAAAKYKIQYILEGHSFITEGVSPSSNYLDGGYINDVHDKFGHLRRETLPTLEFWTFLKWAILYRQKFIRPLWYIDYEKEKAREELIELTGWEYYGGHHLENRASTFTHTVWLPRKFGLDYRNMSLSASVRSGKLDREDAIEMYNQPVVADEELISYVKKRVGFSDEDFENAINGPKRDFRDFKNYKKRFELLRPLFYVLAKRNLVPMSFYLKFCFPIPEDS